MLIAVGSVGPNNQLQIDPDLLRQAMMSAQQPQNSGGGGGHGPNPLKAAADGMMLAAAILRKGRLNNLEQRIRSRRAEVATAEVAVQAAITNGYKYNITAGSPVDPDPTDPAGAILASIQAVDLKTQAAQELARAQQALDEAQDEGEDYLAVDAAADLAADFGAGRQGGYGGGSGGNGGVGPFLAGVGVGAGGTLLLENSNSGSGRRRSR